MHYEQKTTRKIEFSETDMAGLVHFSNYFRYMESAERDFFETAGLNLIQTEAGPLRGWPRTRAECKFSAPLHFGDTIEIHLAVVAVKDRSIEFRFRIFRLDNEGNRTQAGKGHLTTIYAERLPSGELRSIELPPEIREKICPAPAEVLARPKGL
ncbi:MAG: Putative esterase [Opitutia bacterium UBA7350]|nr:MAG: Putative esterase [Opitutae bacterium UBA7350]